MENLSEPILVTRFEDIKKKPDIKPELSDFSPVFEDENYRQHAFEEARRAFLYFYNANKINESFKDTQNDENFLYLKRTRRYGLMVRAAYNFFDKGHKTREPIRTLFSSLGDYNDKYWVSEEKRGEIPPVEEVRRDEVALDRADTPDYKQYVKRVVSKIEELLKEEVVTLRKFHTLRKRLRSCGDILQVVSAENIGSPLHWLTASFVELSSELGHHQEKVIKKGARKTQAFDQAEVKIDPSIRVRFQEIKPFFEKVMGIAE